MKTFKEYVQNENVINESDNFDEVINLIYDDYPKRIHLIKFLCKKDGLEFFEVRNRFSDKAVYSYDGKTLKRITTAKLLEILLGKPKIIYKD